MTENLKLITYEVESYILFKNPKVISELVPKITWDIFIHFNRLSKEIKILKHLRSSFHV